MNLDEYRNSTSSPTPRRDMDIVRMAEANRRIAACLVELERLRQSGDAASAAAGRETVASMEDKLRKLRQARQRIIDERRSSRRQ